MPSAEPETASTPATAAAAVPADGLGKAPARPNREALDKELKEIDAKIEEQKKILDDVKNRLDKIKADQQKGGKKNDGQTKLQELRAATRSVMDERKVLFEQQKQNKEELKKVRDKYDEMRKALKDLNVFSTEDVDKKIREKEFHQATTHLSLKEEKVIINDIKSLTASKKMIGEFDAVKAKRDKCEALSKEISAKLDASKPTLDAAKKAEDAQFKLVNDAREKNNNEDEWQKQVERRAAARKATDALYQQIKVLRKEFRAKDEEYQAWVKAKRAEAKERARKEAEERKEENKLRALQRAEEEADTLHGDDIAMVDQLLTYLSRTEGGSGAANGAAGATEDAAADKAKGRGGADTSGLEQIGKNANALDDDIFGTKKAGKAPKKGKGKKKTAAIVHDIEVMVSFDKLKIDAPLSTADIPTARDKLAAKKEALLKDREVQREKRKLEMSKVEAEIAVKEEKKQAAKTAADDAAEKAVDSAVATPAVEATA